MGLTIEWRELGEIITELANRTVEIDQFEQLREETEKNHNKSIGTCGTTTKELMLVSLES